MDYLLYLSVLGFSTISISWTCILKRKLSIAAVVAVVISYFTRIVPNLPPTMVWRHDPYRYFSATEGMLLGNRIQLPLQFAEETIAVGRGSVWFGLHVLTVFGIEVSGVPNEAVFRFGMGLSGPISLLGLWILYREFMPTNWSLLAGFLTSMMDLFITFQTQYHQQGFGISLMIFALYLFFNHYKQEWNRRVVFVPILIVLAVSHPLAPMVTILWVAGYYVIQALSVTLPKIPTVRETLPANYLVVLGVLIMFIHLFIHVYFIRQATYGMIELVTAGFSPSLSSTGGFATARGQSIFNHSSKFLKLVLAALALPMIGLGLLGRTSKRAFRGVLFLGGIGGTAAAIMIVYTPAMIRLIIFGYIALVPVSVLSMKWAFDNSSPNHDQSICAVVVILCALLVPLSATTAAAPSLIDPHADFRADGFHEVRPVAEGGPAAGDWVQAYIPKSASIDSIFWMKSILEYFANTDQDRISPYYDNQTMEFGLTQPGRPGLKLSASQIYSNGQVIITR